MIEIRNVTKSYDKVEKIIDNMNITIKDGEIFGFIGKNGAGKTTTIKMITGILDTDEGDIFIDGYSINKNPIEAKEKIGFVPDSPDMFMKFKGIEYLEFIMDIYKVPIDNRKNEIERLTKKFKIYNALNNKIETYSHGMKQKLIIVGTLLQKPKNWILDEPLTRIRSFSCI